MKAQRKIYFSENVKFLRRSKNITRSQLAKSLICPAWKVREFENKNEIPFYGDADGLARFFKVSIDSLVFENLSGV